MNVFFGEEKEALNWKKQYGDVSLMYIHINIDYLMFFYLSSFSKKFFFFFFKIIIEKTILIITKKRMHSLKQEKRL